MDISGKDEKNLNKGQKCVFDRLGGSKESGRKREVETVEREKKLGKRGREFHLAQSISLLSDSSFINVIRSNITLWLF